MTPKEVIESKIASLSEQDRDRVTVTRRGVTNGYIVRVDGWDVWLCSERYYEQEDAANHEDVIAQVLRDIDTRLSEGLSEEYLRSLGWRLCDQGIVKPEEIGPAIVRELRRDGHVVRKA